MPDDLHLHTRRPIRLVLDTNVSLDLLVFRDPRWAALAAMLAGGACEAMTDRDCRAEFERVLGYPQFELDGERRAAAIEAFDSLHRVPGAGEYHADPVDGLPRCRDPDDQKFIELAFRTRADALLSKDRDVLKLARRNRRAGLFDILSPADWLARLSGAAPGT